MATAFALRGLTFTASISFLLMATTARSEEIATSCSDCASGKVAFVVANHTGVTIPYQFRWGSKDPWENEILRSGRKITHSHKLRSGDAPTPYVKFDRVAGDGGYTTQVMEMDTTVVGYGGYGASSGSREPKRYYFDYDSTGRYLDLKESRRSPRYPRYGR